MNKCKYYIDAESVIEIDKKVAKEFVDTMLGYHTNLNVFIKLFNMWSDLTIKQRDEVINQCKTEHKSAHQF